MHAYASLWLPVGQTARACRNMCLCYRLERGRGSMHCVSPPAAAAAAVTCCHICSLRLCVSRTMVAPSSAAEYSEADDTCMHTHTHTTRYNVYMPSCARCARRSVFTCTCVYIYVCTCGRTRVVVSLCVCHSHTPLPHSVWHSSAA